MQQLPEAELQAGMVELDQIDLDQVQLGHREEATIEACLTRGSKVVGAVARKDTRGNNVQNSRRSRMPTVAKSPKGTKVHMRNR